MNLVHVVNPFCAEPSSDLFVAQPITFESMLRARDFAVGESGGKVAVRLTAAQYPEDHDVLPERFERTEDLRRSVLDFGRFDPPRVLPLLIDILRAGAAAAPEAEWMIYTNVDIGLQPHFYVSVEALIKQGLRAFTINRRTMPATYDSPKELPLIWGQCGEAHPGSDCFVFPKAMVDDFVLGNCCLGAPGVGLALLANMRVLTGERFAILKDQHLTFHIGKDRVWREPHYQGYTAFNRDELMECLSRLGARFGDLGQDPVIGKYVRSVHKRARMASGRNRRWWAFGGRFPRFRGKS